MAIKNVGGRKNQMSNRLLAINITFAVVDTIIAALAICAFGWGAWHFGRWWLLLFTIVPLMLFQGHSIIVDADIEAARKGSDNHS
jgi:hypothetical protein